MDEIKAILERDWYAQLGSQDWELAAEDGEWITSGASSSSVSFSDEDEKVKKEESEGKVQCKLCYTYVKKSSLAAHKARKHGRGKLHKCDHCDFTTYYSSCLPKHLKQKHDIGDDILVKMCLVCGYESLTNHGMKSHITRIHGKEEWDTWNSYDWSKHDPATHVFKWKNRPKNHIPHVPKLR